jgi:hypothetical protein
MNKIENEREGPPSSPDPLLPSPIRHSRRTTLRRERRGEASILGGEEGAGAHLRGRMRERRGHGGTRFVAGLQKSRACETGVVGLRMMCADKRLRFCHT